MFNDSEISQLSEFMLTNLPMLELRDQHLITHSYFRGEIQHGLSIHFL